MSRTGRTIVFALAAGVALLPNPALAQSNDGGISSEAIGLIVALVIGLVILFIPTFIAFRRGHPNRWPIFLVNLIFGGTGLGWFGSLIWALNAVHKSPTGSQGGESGLNVFVNDVKTVQVAGTAATPPLHAGLAPLHEDVDPVAQLHRLKALFDKGVIDADEHRQLRKPLLDRLSGTP